jgi:4a-hydroxytetrahydrobiopterin dehydratase
MFIMDESCDLKKKHCVPCEGGTKPFSAKEAAKMAKDTPGWKIEGAKVRKISKDYKFKDFKGALAFVNRVGRIAESEGHHPDISIYSWNRVRLTNYTHAIGGLSENDFILAAKIDQK